MTSLLFRPRMKAAAAGWSAAMLAGCATFSSDGGLDSVAAMTQDRTGQAVRFAKPGSNTGSTDSSVRQLLDKPLSADAAIRIALMNNKGLQASLAVLGMAEADLVQAGRLPNPGMTFGRMRGAGGIETERGVMFSLLGLLTMPIRADIEGRRFEQAKLQAASQALQLAADTRRAYFNAVAARQTAHYMEQAGSAAEAGAELAKRMARVGNWSKLDQARQQVFYAGTMTRIAGARHNVTATREQLTRLMGLWGAGTAFTLPERLPDLPKAPNDIADIEVQAMSQRLDLKIALRDTEATASALGLGKTTGFINVFDAGYKNTSETSQPRADGYEITLELPIFDWSGSRTAKAEAAYMQSLHRTADTAIRARSEVRTAYSAYRTSYDVARHYGQEIVPLRKKISDEVLVRYNGMLASVFELLSDARDQIDSVSTAIEAQRDFWIADTDLQAAINGTGGVAAQIPGASAANAQQKH